MAPGRASIRVAFAAAVVLNFIAPGAAHVVTAVTGSTTSLVADRTTAVIGEIPVLLTATVDQGGIPTFGTVTFTDRAAGAGGQAGAAVALGPATVDPYTGIATLATNTLRVGTHSLRAVYAGLPGPGGVSGSTSAPVTIVIVPDTSVNATYKARLGTFYPWKDGFRDTETLGGVLAERATIVIRIYNASDHLVKTVSVGTRNAGPWSTTWAGKTTSGANVPAGKYRTVATITDVPGNTKTLTAYTTANWKKATWTTVTVTRNGNQGSFYVDAGDLGKVYYSPDYPKGVILDSGPMIRDCTGCGFVGAQFTFTLVNALEYRHIYVEVRGHGFDDREHTGEVWILDPVSQTLKYGYPLYMYDDRYVTSGVQVSSAYVSATHHVEAWLNMEQRWGDAYDVKYVKITYQYPVLH